MTPSITVSLIGIAVAVAGIAFNIWWKRYRAARLFLAFFTKVRGWLQGIESIAYDKTRGIFMSMGPRSIMGQLAGLNELFADYVKFKLQAQDLLSDQLMKTIEDGHRAALRMTEGYAEMAKPYIEGSAQWADEDPSLLAWWNLNREFLRNTLQILDGVIAALSAVGRKDVLIPLRSFKRSAQKTWRRVARVIHRRTSGRAP